MSVFDDALARASAAVDAVFADDEFWIYQPFTVAAGNVNGMPSPDPDRPAVKIKGIYLGEYARANSVEARKQGVKPERPGHASARPQFDFDGTQLPYKPRQGDRLTRCKTGAVYHVAEVKFPVGGPRYQLDLNFMSQGG